MVLSLSYAVELAVGMQVMVTFNIEKGLGAASGTKGAVEQTILKWRETTAESPR